MRHIMLLLFRDAPAVKLHSKIYNLWDLMPLDITYITVKKYIVMTALQCIISRLLLSLNSMSSVQDATCVVNL